MSISKIIKFSNMCMKTCQIEAPVKTEEKLNIKFLRFHVLQLILLLETLELKPAIILLADTQLSESKPLNKQHINGYQAIESKT